ncbi:MAG: GNAT family N-acetyltransferase [Bacilli bacterium]|nr:GNAT family N-acetyltransferase [Bacilli bacterium]
MIRELSINDLDFIYVLGDTLHNNYKSLNSYSDLNEGVNKTYIISESDVIVGFIHVQELIDEIDIIDVVVCEKYRNKGYATMLFNYCFNKYSNRKFILEVSSGNIPALNLYKKMGFKVINIRNKYYGISDAYVMEKR